MFQVIQQKTLFICLFTEDREGDYMKKIFAVVLVLSVLFLMSCTQPASSYVEMEEDVKVEDNASRSIILNKEEIQLKVGDTFQLSATILPEGNTSGAVFSSENAAIASVNSSGFITGAALGEVKVSATFNGVSKSCSVYVVEELVDVAGPPPATTPADTTTTPVVNPQIPADFVLTFEGGYFYGRKYSYTISGNNITKTDAGFSIAEDPSLNLSSFNDKLLEVNFKKSDGDYFVRLKSGRPGTAVSDYELVKCSDVNETNFIVWRDGNILIWAQ